MSAQEFRINGKLQRDEMEEIDLKISEDTAMTSNFDGLKILTRTLAALYKIKIALVSRSQIMYL